MSTGYVIYLCAQFLQEVIVGQCVLKIVIVLTDGATGHLEEAP